MIPPWPKPRRINGTIVPFVRGRRRRSSVLDRLMVTDTADPRGDRVLLWVAVRVPSRARWLRRLVDDHRLDRAIADRAELLEGLRATAQTPPVTRSRPVVDHSRAVSRLWQLHAQEGTG